MAASHINRRRRREAAERAAAAERNKQEELERRNNDMVAPWINTNSAPAAKKVQPVPAAPAEAAVAIVADAPEPTSVDELGPVAEEEAPVAEEEVPVAEEEASVADVDLTKLRKSELVAMCAEQGLETKGLTKAELITLLED